MKIMILLSLLMIFATSPAALAKKPPIQFHIEKINDTLFTLRPEKIWRVNSSNIVYVGKNSLLLIDAQADPYLAKQLLGTIRREISTLPIEYVLITHPHMDHIGGLEAIKKAYPAAKIIGHESVVDFLKNQSPKEQHWEVEDWFKPLRAQKQAALEQSRDPKLKQQLAQQVTEISDYIDDIATIHFVQPDLTFNKKLNINLGSDPIEMVHLGHAHTPGDSLIFFPTHKILATGDLFHNLDPLFWAEANPDNWISILDQIVQYDVTTYLGGHGDAITDKSVLHAWRNYMVEITGLVKQAKAKGEALADVQKRINVPDVKSLTVNHYAERIDSWGARLMNFEDTKDARLDRAIASLWAHY